MGVFGPRRPGHSSVRLHLLALGREGHLLPVVTAALAATVIKDGDHGRGRRLVIRLREAGAEGHRLAQRAEVGGLGLRSAQERRGGGGGGASLHDLQRDR